MWQAFLQDKISKAVGASVSFEKLSISPFRGMVDGQGLRAAIDESATPFLTVERVRLKVELTQLLSKRLQVEMVLIERPVVTVETGPGSATNLPLEHFNRPKPLPQPEPPSMEPKQESSSWAAGLKQLVIGDGLVRYRDRTSGYELEAGPINLQIDQGDGGVATIAGGVGGTRRLDRPAQWPPLRLSGELSGVDQLRELRGITGRLTAEADRLLRVNVERKPGETMIDLSLAVVPAEVVAVLPEAWVSQIPGLLLEARSEIRWKLWL